MRKMIFSWTPKNKTLNNHVNMKSIPFAFFILLLFSCKKSYNLESPNCNQTENDNYEFVLGDTIFVTVPDKKPSRHKFRRIKVENDELIYYGLSLQNNVLTLDKYNLTQRKFIAATELEQSSLKVPGNFDVSNDELIMTSEYPPVLYRIEKTGKLKEKFAFAGNKNSVREFIFENLESSHFPEMIADDKVLLTRNPVDFWTIEDKSSVHYFSVFDMKSQHEKTFGKPEGIYAENDIEYPYILSYPYKLLTDKFIILSFPLDWNFYVYDRQTLTFVKKNCATSKFFTKLNVPDKLWAYTDDSQLEVNQLITTGSFEPLAYHANLRIFSRIVAHPQELKNAEGDLRSDLNRRYSLQIFDEDLQMKGELILEQNYNWIFAESIPDGYLVAGWAEKAIQDDYLPFVYKFVLKRK